MQVKVSCLFFSQSGKKLMPRCFPVEQKIKVSDEDVIPDEDKLQAYLFTTQDEEIQ